MSAFPLQQMLRRQAGDRYHLPHQSAVRAVETRDQFNLIDLETGWKFDLILRKDRPFSVQEFANRLPVVIDGTSTWISRAEDTVLSKLEWASLTDAERQMRDVSSVIHAKGDTIDDEHLDRWAAELGVVELLAEARRLAAG